MNISDRATIASIFRALKDTGTTAPKAVTAANANAVRVATAARALAPRPDDLGAAVTAALIAGKDPGLDPTVISLIVRAQVGNEGIGQMVDGQVYGRLQEACHEHADELVDIWREPFTAAATALTSARGVLGGLDLTDTASIVRIGPAATEQWAAATTAVKTIDTIDGGWQALGEFTRLSPRNPIYPALRFVDATLDQWADHHLERRKIDGWEAARLGLTLSLPTFAEYHQRIRTIEQAAAARAAADQEAARNRATGRRPQPAA